MPHDHTRHEPQWRDYPQSRRRGRERSGRHVSFCADVERFVDIDAGLADVARPVAWGDYDSDGLLDCVSGSFLYHNDSNGAFTQSPQSTGSSGRFGLLGRLQPGR